MLVLSRKKNESIIIGDRITVMVVEIRGDKVRLGVDAPREMSVHRKEIHEAIQQERAEFGREREERLDSLENQERTKGK